MDFKFINWADTYKGWDTYEDLSFGNRIVHWETAYEINRINDFNYTILLNDMCWPESKLIFLPNTLILPKELQDKITEKDGADIITYDMSVDILKNKTKLPNWTHWKPNFEYSKIEDIYGFEVDFKPLSNIRLQNSKIDNFIKDKMSDVVGIHIRRNKGITFTNEDMIKLPSDVRESYLVLRRDDFFYKNYEYIKDEKYFHIIDHILTINPNQKFYISTDLTYDLISYYKDIYGDKIIMKEDIITFANQCLSDSGINTNEIHKRIIEDVIDLFSLSYCKLLLKSNISSWSHVAERYTDKRAIYVTDNLEIINEFYIKSGLNKNSFN